MSQILQSIEARWFLPADDVNVPLLAQLFASAKDVETRSDYYAPTGRDDLGVKARIASSRPAKLETKYRTEVVGNREVAPGLFAAVEKWSKISVEVTDAAKSSIETVWRKIDKERRRRKLALEGGRVEEIALDRQASAGCSAELTKMSFKIGDGVETQWTFALEAFGEMTSTLEDVLIASSQHLLAAAPHVALEVTHSRGYPAWLTERFW